MKLFSIISKIFFKGKPEFGKWKNKHCPRYDELEVILGNDVATGERSTAGNDDISPINGTIRNLQHLT